MSTTRKPAETNRDRLARLLAETSDAPTARGRLLALSDACCQVAYVLAPRVAADALGSCCTHGADALADMSTRQRDAYRAVGVGYLLNAVTDVTDDGAPATACAVMLAAEHMGDIATRTPSARGVADALADLARVLGARLCPSHLATWAPEPEHMAAARRTARGYDLADIDAPEPTEPATCQQCATLAAAPWAERPRSLADLAERHAAEHIDAEHIDAEHIDAEPVPALLAARRDEHGRIVQATWEHHGARYLTRWNAAEQAHLAFGRGQGGAWSMGAIDAPTTRAIVAAANLADATWSARVADAERRAGGVRP